MNHPWTGKNAPNRIQQPMSQSLGATDLPEPFEQIDLPRGWIVGLGPRRPDIHRPGTRRPRHALRASAVQPLALRAPVEASTITTPTVCMPAGLTMSVVTMDDGGALIGCHHDRRRLRARVGQTATPVVPPREAGLGA